MELRKGLGVDGVDGGRLVEVVGGERVHRSDVIGVELECGLVGARAWQSLCAV